MTNFLQRNRQETNQCGWAQPGGVYEYVQYLGDHGRMPPPTVRWPGSQCKTFQKPQETISKQPKNKIVLKYSMTILTFMSLNVDISNWLVLYQLILYIHVDIPTLKMLFCYTKCLCFSTRCHWVSTFVFSILSTGLEVGVRSPGHLLLWESCQILEEYPESSRVQGNLTIFYLTIFYLTIFYFIIDYYAFLLSFYITFDKSIFFLCKIYFFCKFWQKYFSLVYLSLWTENTCTFIYCFIRWCSIHPRCSSCSWRRRGLRWGPDNTYSFSVPAFPGLSGIPSLSLR